jgi:guanylate kinase
MSKLVIITAPSGAGKTSIVKGLMQSGLALDFSVSACTRSRREGEVDGKDYYFLSAERFRDMVANGEFAEHEEVYDGMYYGTLKSEISRIGNEGKAALFDIDVKGALNLKQQYGKDALTIFIKAPSLEALKERLNSRNTETEESLKKRIDKASMEMTYEEKFDKTIVNDELEKAVEKAIDYTKEFLSNS